MLTKTVKFQPRGKNNFITIPIEMVREYGLEEGDTLLVKFDGEKIIAEKC